jgi:tRNA-2-methylthio-N6-dimethylallyladenosine synthase
MKYHIWTAGCQMNVADSQRVASALESMGYKPEKQAEKADVIVLNTCVVRQSAEEKAYGRINSLKPIKQKRPEVVINLMGCLVGVKGFDVLKERFPQVDVFSPPSDPGPLLAFLTQDETKALEDAETSRRFAMMDGSLTLPVHEQGKLVSAHVPVVLGCSHACTFCVIPYKRGIERSRPVGDIVAEIRSLVRQGIKEVTLLGQIVDRYGKDIPDGPNLAQLLRIVHDLEGLERIRFLTSHPNWMTADLLDAVAELPKVMPHFEVPVQAGDDIVLERMRRGYTADDYRKLVNEIRQRIPEASIATDIIVGFPGETSDHFQATYDLMAELKMDVAHLARYSTRAGTVAARKLGDDVSDEEKWRRYRLLEELQKDIATEIHARLMGETVDVLFEQKVKGRWRGRTPTNKLVFVESKENLRGKVLPAQITWTGPWSMQARIAGFKAKNIPLTVDAATN